MQVFGRFDDYELSFDQDIHGAQELLVRVVDQETRPRQRRTPGQWADAQVGSPAQEMYDPGTRQFTVLTLDHAQDRPTDRGRQRVEGGFGVRG